MPSVPEIEAELRRLLNPGVFAPLRMAQVRGEPLHLRDRVLTLPVMVALVLSIVYRQLPSLHEALRLLHTQGLLWAEPIQVSVPALSQRLSRLPAQLWHDLLHQVLEQLPLDEVQRREKAVVPEAWRSVQEHFSAIWHADGSTLDALRRKAGFETPPDQSKTQVKKQDKAVDKTTPHEVAGKMMVVVSAWSHLPVQLWYEAEQIFSDKLFNERLLASLPLGGLLVFDLGFFGFPFLDSFTDQGKFFVTRLREKTSFIVQQELGRGQFWSDQIVHLGCYRSNPSRHAVRLVCVQWEGVEYRYLTNVLNPQVLSARQVSELYRQRWRIEEAFATTKRLLGLAYLWVGGGNGILVQIFATWIFYIVLVSLCQQVAQRLGVPLERISKEMVFRGLYHVAHAQQQQPSTDAVTYLVEHHKILSLVKEVRKRHRLRDDQAATVWKDALC